MSDLDDELRAQYERYRTRTAEPLSFEDWLQDTVNQTMVRASDAGRCGVSDFDDRYTDADRSTLFHVGSELSERIEQLEAALRALVGNEDAGIAISIVGEDVYDEQAQCIYCSAYSVVDVSTVDHAPDCPIVEGRKALGESNTTP